MRIDDALSYLEFGDPCSSDFDVALNAVIYALKALEPAVAYWIPCNGKSHIWYCSGCGEKINYNDARRTYKTEKKPVEAVNRYCRGCGATMVPHPTDEQREATP